MSRKNTEHLGMRVPREVADEVVEYAQEVERPLSYVLRQWVTERLHLERARKEGAEGE